MTFSRQIGRYNLHQLGWHAFEDLCVLIMREVLGETCTRFPLGRDGGRDGWYSGASSCRLLNQNQMAGSFVIQCKHTTKRDSNISLSTLDSEILKIQKLTLGKQLHYILMTNKSLPAEKEQEIRTNFEKHLNGGRCLILAECWIEDTIDRHAALRRLVPRLYGIGDLSQILMGALHDQTKALLEDAKPRLQTFVATSSYRAAAKKLSEHGFIILTGPPASGKSSIAEMLCLTASAENPDTRISRIESATLFTSTWSPTDNKVIYWVDDVFGETNLDKENLKQWSSVFQKIESSRKRGVCFIFSSRDYIFNEAVSGIKFSTSKSLDTAKIAVDATDLSRDEREKILYNHIKHGNLPADRRESLKPHLSSAAKLSSFTPEQARRLGDNKLTLSATPSWEAVEEFFDKPVSHFEEVLHGLPASANAALVLCLLSNNSVIYPLQENDSSTMVCAEYGISFSELKNSFKILEGSLLKRIRHATTESWQFHHPSMIDALQNLLAKDSSRLELYITSAQPNSLLRETTTIDSRFSDERQLIFIPSSVYEKLIRRLTDTNIRVSSLTGYLAGRASDELLVKIENTAPAVIDRALTAIFDREEFDMVAQLAVRLSNINDGAMMTDERTAIISQTFATSLIKHYVIGFLYDEEFCQKFPAIVTSVLAIDIESGFRSIANLRSWCMDECTTSYQAARAEDTLTRHIELLQTALEQSQSYGDAELSALHKVGNFYLQQIGDVLKDLWAYEEEHGEDLYDAWKESVREEEYEYYYECEFGRFADVDIDVSPESSAGPVGGSSLSVSGNHPVAIDDLNDISELDVLN